MKIPKRRCPASEFVSSHNVSGVVEFGRRLNGITQRYMEGILDEFVVFNEELSTNDIMLLAHF